jgi:hypothetical protein
VIEVNSCADGVSSNTNGINNNGGGNVDLEIVFEVDNEGEMEDAKINSGPPGSESDLIFTK